MERHIRKKRGAVHCEQELSNVFCGGFSLNDNQECGLQFFLNVEKDDGELTTIIYGRDEEQVQEAVTAHVGKNDEVA